MPAGAGGEGQVEHSDIVLVLVVHHPLYRAHDVQEVALAGHVEGLDGNQAHIRSHSLVVSCLLPLEGGRATVGYHAAHVGAVATGVENRLRQGVVDGVVVGDYARLAGRVQGQGRVLPEPGIDNGHGHVFAGDPQ